MFKTGGQLVPGTFVVGELQAFDPEGDVSLLVHKTQRIRVSSSILGFHSKAFRAMFKGYFSEAAKLSENSSSSSPTEIELPDDDPEAMLLVCAILHGKVLQLQCQPSSRQLLKAAMHAEKYDCIAAVTPVMVLWVPRKSDFTCGPRLLGTDLDYLTTAYVLGLPKEFGLFSASINRWATDFIHILVPEDDSHRVTLPSKVFAHLEEARAARRNQMITTIQNVIFSGVSEAKLSGIYHDLWEWLQSAHLIESRLAKMESDLRAMRTKHLSQQTPDPKLHAFFASFMVPIDNGICLACIKSKSSSRKDIKCSYVLHILKSDEACITQPLCLR